MIDRSLIKDHCQVVASCGKPVGVVDHLEYDYIKLVKNDPESGGQHHYIPLSWIDKIDDNKVILNKNHGEVLANWKTELPD
ncbi:DUF2171 domain-containing protein [Arsenophonus nasoniae]|uniref:DUF2171 domain-containing protein n=1 Tax=Arsenophonus nasoniae TaxID=638 RepID=UPI00387970B6